VSCGRVQDRSQPACDLCGCTLREALLPAVLAGKFRIERQVGAGGMGVVYRAQDLELERTVAIKVLPRVAPEATARLRREARAMAAVQHPHLAIIHSMESWRGTPVLVIEYLAGGTVAGRIRHGALPVADVLTLGVVVADVLQHVHRAGYLHRDVKPSNIGYTESGAPKLLDFGLARLVSTLTALSADSATVTAGSPATSEDLSSATTAAVGQTAAQRIVGTPAYLPPEAIALAPPAVSVDLWGLGVTLYEALTGLNPFVAPTLAETVSLIERAVVPDPRERRTECPPALAAFLLSALARVPDRRPQTALEFASRLRTVDRDLRARAAWPAT
jgi:serine/threonine-protein kinase